MLLASQSGGEDRLRPWAQCPGALHSTCTTCEVLPDESSCKTERPADISVLLVFLITGFFNSKESQELSY